MLRPRLCVHEARSRSHRRLILISHCSRISYHIACLTQSRFMTLQRCISTVQL